MQIRVKLGLVAIVGLGVVVPAAPATAGGQPSSFFAPLHQASSTSHPASRGPSSTPHHPAAPSFFAPLGGVPHAAPSPSLMTLAPTTISGGAAAHVQAEAEPVRHASFTSRLGSMLKGSGAKKAWEGSSASLKLERVEAARSRGTLHELPGVIAELDQEIAAASADGSDPKAQAVRVSQLGLARVRAQLALNESPDSKLRLTGHSPESWEQHVRQLDRNAASATTQTSEGELVRSLDGLKGEIDRARAMVQSHEQALVRFEEKVPLLVGGELKKEANLTRQRIVAFKDGELASKIALHDAARDVLRARVSARLGSEREDFRQRSYRAADLRDLRDGGIAPALVDATTARDELVAALSERQGEAMEEWQEQRTERDVRSGWTTIDTSGTERMMAGMYASDAQAHTAKANQAIQRLATKLQQLGLDRKMANEGLFDPGSGDLYSASTAGPSWNTELFLPDIFNQLGDMSAQANLRNVRYAVEQKLASLTALHAEVSRREVGERGWVDQVIDDDLARQRASR